MYHDSMVKKARYYLSQGMLKCRPETLADIKATVEELEVGAHYEATYLYEMYVKAMRAQGREPVHQVPFGRMLIEYGALRKAKWSTERGQMVRGWII